MRHIKKTASLKEFEAWKLSNPSKDYNDFKLDRSATSIKYSLKEQLLREQGYICCYCGTRIENNIQTVIEHIYPKTNNDYKHLELEYTNLLVSCKGGQNERRAARREGRSEEDIKLIPLHCDTSKDDKIIPIIPLQSDCEKCFMYNNDGEILVEEESPAEITCKILNLNNRVLKNLRAKAFEVYSMDFLELDNIEDPTEMKIKAEEIYREITNLKAEKYEPYFFCLANYIRNSYL